MDNEVDQWIDNHMNNLIGDLADNIAIPSISDPRDAAAEPFGKPAAEALKQALAVAEKLGFRTGNVDGYAGYAEFGEGEETLGILAHLDVVPAGDGWTHEPFQATTVNGKIYGRGMRDDKGPAFSTMYALAAVKENHYRFARKVRLIFGLNEECGMQCIDHYLQKEKAPDLSFSPDGDYPLTNAEKSSYFAIYNCGFSSEIELEGGKIANAVPGSATAFIKADPKKAQQLADEYSRRTGFGIQIAQCDDGRLQILVKGVQGHGAQPQLAKNAIAGAVGFLLELPVSERDRTELQRLQHNYFDDCCGKTVGLCISDATGQTTINIPIIHWNKDGYELWMDIRCPISLKQEEISAKLDAAMKGAVPKMQYFSKGLYVPEDHELVRHLLHIYEARTGKKEKPKRSGGGTYARKLPNAVSFGVEYEGSGTGAHQPDEFATPEELNFNAKIMADAIIALACVKS